MLIRLVDDGRGIDPDRIADAAVRRGLLSAAEAAALDPRGKLSLIWRPGFSTASQVTDISGRGVGLDIVQSAIARARGNVSVQSEPGKGTTFTLTLPLSLSVVRTLLLRDGDATVAAPIVQIEGVHLVRTADVGTTTQGAHVRVEDRTLPLLAQGLATSAPLQERLRREEVVILEVRLSAERSVGFVIDEVLGEEDTLMKALPRYLQHRNAFVGCGVAGDGRPYAIIDLHQLAAHAWAAGGAPGGGSSVLTADWRVMGQPSRPLVLVVDDSLFMRRSLAAVYEGGGFRVITAEDGEAALTAIAHLGLPDLVSLDMEMPRMNGLEMLAVLRQLPGGQRVPVLMITTRGQARHREAALSAGVAHYFIKPFNDEDLLVAAKGLCGARPAAAASERNR